MQLGARFGACTMGVFTEVICPSLGVVLSLALYLSPMPAVLRVIRERRLDDLNTTPIALMVLSTVTWTGYGCALPNRYIIAASGPGIALTIWYVVSVLPLMGSDPGLATFRMLIVSAAIISTNEWTFAHLWLPESQRKIFMGGFATTISVILYASPLSTAVEVIRARDAGSILASLTIAQLLNCGMWAAYGLAIEDPWISVPNVLGVGLAGLQLLLKACFPAASSQPTAEETVPLKSPTTESALEEAEQPAFDDQVADDARQSRGGEPAL